MTVYKTVIQVEVLHEEPVWGTTNLEDVQYEITYGDCSGLVEIVSTQPLTERALIEECERHGTDPTFFTDALDETFADEED